MASSFRTDFPAFPYVRITRKRRPLPAKRDLFAVFDRVRFLRSQMLTANVTPTEAWLGPDAAAQVREGMESDPAFYGIRPGDSLEGAKIDGLTIRLSQSPGIRVGVSIG